MKIRIDPPTPGGNLENLILILLAIVAVAVIFALAAAGIAAMWILFHAKTEIAVTFMIVLLIVIISVLIYRYERS